MWPRIGTTRTYERNWPRFIRKSKRLYRNGCGMRAGIISFLLTICALGAPREEYKRDFQKTAMLPGGRMLRIEHSLGPVNVHTQGKGEVSVSAVIRCSAQNANAARSFCDSIQIRVEESSGGITIRTEYPKTSSNNNLGYSVNMDVVMPET